MLVRRRTWIWIANAQINEGFGKTYVQQFYVNIAQYLLFFKYKIYFKKYVFTPIFRYLKNIYYLELSYIKSLLMLLVALSIFILRIYFQLQTFTSPGIFRLFWSPILKRYQFVFLISIRWAPPFTLPFLNFIAQLPSLPPRRCLLLPGLSLLRHRRPIGPISVEVSTLNR